MFYGRAIVSAILQTLSAHHKKRFVFPDACYLIEINIIQLKQRTEHRLFTVANSRNMSLITKQGADVVNLIIGTYNKD